MTKTDHDHPLWIALDKAQMDISSLSQRLTEIRAHIAQLDLGTKHRPLVCPHCGPWHLGPTKLAEHLYAVDPAKYPLPAHWAAGDARAHSLPGETESEAAA